MIEEIPTNLDGERLDRIVAMLGDVSRAEAAALINAGKVVLDGVVITSGKARLRAGQRIEFDDDMDRSPARPLADASIDVTMAYVDQDLIVVDKAEGLVVHPGAGNPDRTLVNALLARFPEIADVGDQTRPGIVHRLDKGTSGLLVVARTQAAYEGLVEALSSHAVTRRYVALVWGVPESRSGVIDAPLGRSPRDPLKMGVVLGGRPARTHYEVDETFTEPMVLASLSCWLETGRTHQIRVHLAAIGTPVVGDLTYGKRRLIPGVMRPMLHAEHLAFVHPVTGAQMAFDSPVAADMAAVLSSLR